jgi:Helicase associated domain
LQGGEAGDEKKSKTWEEHYLDLIDFQKKHGHVKHKKLDEGYGALFHWLSYQKKQWKRMLQGQHCCIRHDHIQLLCDVGVGKSLKGGPIDFRREALDAVWQSFFQELVQFKKVSHPSRSPFHCPVLFKSSSCLTS